FGSGELDKEKKAAEAAAGAPAPAAGSAADKAASSVASSGSATGTATAIAAAPAASSVASSAAATGAATAATAQSSPVQPPAGQKKLAIWQKLGKLIQGEPQVADASAFYRTLQAKLELRQALPADALSRLGTQRASAIVAALTEGGVNPASARTAAPEAVQADAGQPVNLKLGLSAK
ncbi:MAG: hypothetical protein V4578_02720, partial [Pseudomonadota bacterium]